TTEVFNKMGRAGPIWVNVGKISISGIPSVLLIFSSKRVCDCLCREELDKHVLDAAAIKEQIKIKPQVSATESVADEFLKLKYRQGSYQLENVGVSVAERKVEGQGYSLDFDWPKNASPGSYRVSVSACRDGNVIHSQEIPIAVEEIGFPATISGLARERPAIYGIISVVAAVLAGFGIDFITTKVFKKKITSSH
ncbi:MAG: TIGR02186 family protein, partial [Deltaproteobacteria bacterium]